MNKSRKKSYDTLRKVIFIILMVVTSLGIVKSLFVSFDIDESYAIAEAYRLVTGDKLIFDMWEPHQFSAFFPALLMLPFRGLLQSTDYCVLILRVLGTIIHLLVGAYLYSTAKGAIGKNGAFLAFIFHVNFLPKWIASPEFELMHYWCMILIFLLLYRDVKSKYRIRVVIAALLYMVSGLCYPTMVLLLPLYVIGLLRMKKGRDAAYFAFFSVVPSVFFLLLLITPMGLEKFMKYLGYVLSDPSHASETPFEKWTGIGMDALQTGALLGLSLLAAAVITGIIILAGRKKRVISKKNAVLLVFAVSATLLSLRAIYGYLLGDENQFTTQVRYIPAFLFVLLAAFIFRKEMQRELWFGILPALVCVPAVLFISNMGLNVALSKLFPALIAGFFVLGKIRAKEDDAKSGAEPEGEAADPGSVFAMRGAKISALALLLCLFVCRILLIRVTGCLPVTVRAPLTLVKEGPAAGIWVPEKPGLYWNESYDVLTQLLPKDANILYVGREQLFYVCFVNRVCTPSVQGTTVFDETYAAYYEEFPEKTPEIVVLDRSFEEEPCYAGVVNGEDLRDEWIKEWISEHFETEKTTEVGNYTILYLEEK